MADPTVEPTDYLNMSDEDMMKMGTPDFSQVAVEEVIPTTEPAEVVEELPAVTEPVAVIEPEVPAVVAEEGANEQAEVTEPLAGTEGADPVPAAAEVQEPVASEVDYKSEFDKVLAPFKANGRDMQVKNADEAIALMQMGANYNKKMAGLKPHLALIKQLENEGLLSNEKIGFLIDLSKKNPEAIGKLIQDSGIDPLDLNSDAVKAYVPNTYAVSEKEQAFDEVLESIKDTPTYKRTIDAVANEWDQTSKAQLGDHPQVLKIINDHMASGIYDLITAEVDRQKALGKLPGVPALAAYNQIGDSMNAAGAFNHLQAQAEIAPAAVKKVVVAAPAGNKQAVQEQRRAASPTKTVAPKVTSAEFNPLSLSDAEFAKLGNPQFL